MLILAVIGATTKNTPNTATVPTTPATTTVPDPAFQSDMNEVFVDGETISADLRDATTTGVYTRVAGDCLALSTEVRAWQSDPTPESLTSNQRLKLRDGQKLLILGASECETAASNQGGFDTTASTFTAGTDLIKVAVAQLGT